MKITSFEEYSKRAAETQMESCKNEDYLRLGLISEIGELAAIFKRAIRGDFKLEDKRQDILLELGDICWYLDRLYGLDGYEFGNILTPNSHAISVPVLIWDMTECIDAYYIIVNIVDIARTLGFTIWDVLTANVEKLAKRKERGLITGSGDHRGEVTEEGGAE